ncbi:MAG: hypothetical protein HW421_2171 [Ignavibacteria bacterium]|nr:hypothetical protein [Ignavibacteria bacterium]
MTRFLIIFLLIGIIIFIGGYYLNRLILKFQKIFSPEIKNNYSQTKRKKEEILYSKGDVIVMKGDADENDKAN